MLDGAAQAEPRCKRNAAGGSQGRAGEVHHDHPEAAAVEEEVGCFKGALGVAGASHPEKTVETDPGGGGADGFERISGVDKSANFIAHGGGGERGDQQAGTSRGSRSNDFREAAAGEASAEGVESGN